VAVTKHGMKTNHSKGAAGWRRQRCPVIAPAVFHRQDSAYRHWLLANADGQVVNIQTFVIHGVGCRHIEPLTTMHPKACFAPANLNLFRRWAEYHYGVRPRLCWTCGGFPPLNSPPAFRASDASTSPTSAAPPMSPRAPSCKVGRRVAPSTPHSTTIAVRQPLSPGRSGEHSTKGTRVRPATRTLPAGPPQSRTASRYVHPETRPAQQPSWSALDRRRYDTALNFAMRRSDGHLFATLVAWHLARNGAAWREEAVAANVLINALVAVGAPDFATAVMHATRLAKDRLDPHALARLQRARHGGGKIIRRKTLWRLLDTGRLEIMALDIRSLLGGELSPTWLDRRFSFLSKQVARYRSAFAWPAPPPGNTGPPPFDGSRRVRLLS
jgi:hypothetical protein